MCKKDKKLLDIVSAIWGIYWILGGRGGRVKLFLNAPMISSTIDFFAQKSSISAPKIHKKSIFSSKCAYIFPQIAPII